MAARTAPSLVTVPDAIFATLGTERPVDIIEFVTSDRWLNRPNLYPRQATLLKLIFLQEEIFTPYDYDVIGEWGEGFKLTDMPPDETIWKYSGDWGIQPDALERMRYLRDVERRPWFRTILNASGRRSGKGHLGALCGAYVLWHYIAKGDPRADFGVDPDKRLSCQVFAGKKDQAKANQWRDLVNVILGAPCFSEYVGTPLTESLTVMAPVDKIRMDNLRKRGIKTDMDLSTFEIVPKEATTMAARGPASFMQCLDPSTPVLTADLRWVPIGDIQIGDELVGVDEHPEPGKQRKLRRSTVQSVWRTHKPALRLTFEDGSTVVCSEDHRWLFRHNSGGNNTSWRTAAELKIGDHIRHLVDPWEPDASFGAGYLAGVFDGEGCIVSTGKRFGSDILFAQNPGVVLDTVSAAMSERGFTFLPNRDIDAHKCQQWAVRGLSDCLRFIGQIRPPRLLATAHHLWEGRAIRGGITPTGRVGTSMMKRIVAIDSLPAQGLVDITTTTRTFIANGLVSHNCYDEMAHMVATTGGSRSASEVWESATPALDQFKKDSFIYCGSSPWEMTGKFYELCQQAVSIEADTRQPVYPENLIIQLPSWDIYVDWERTLVPFPIRPAYERNGIPVPAKNFLRLRGAIQEYDSAMQRLERANPETFRVERRAKWATAMDAYLPAEHVRKMFAPWNGRTLVMETRGNPTIDYTMHGDPGKTGSNFGFAVAHKEFVDGSEFPHVVFDYIVGWAPGDFPSMEMDYIEIEERIKGMIDGFLPSDVTFDQWNSIGLIQRLQKHANRGFKPCTVAERGATANVNWRTAETFKTALSLGLIHAPYYELAEMECLFLRKLAGDKVDHPMAGPCTTKDVYDAMSIVVHKLIGNEISNFLGQEFMALELSGTMPGPAGDQRIAQAFSEFGSAGPRSASPRGVPPSGRLSRTPGMPRDLGRRR